MTDNTNQYRKFQQLVCLVGENPIPVYLGIQQFAESSATVVLVCSKETREVANRLKKVLTERRPDLKFPINFEVLANAYNPHMVRQHLEKLVDAYPNAALNYTGGTKVMSSFSVLPWNFRKENGHWKEVSSVAFYLEEEGSKFHFTDRSEPIDLAADSNLDIPALRQLHDIEIQKPGSRMEVSVEELKALFIKQITSPILLKHPDEYPIKANWISDTLGSRRTLLECLSLENRAEWEKHKCEEGTPKNAYEKSDLHKQIKFFRGDWLELLVETILRQITSDWTLRLHDGDPEKPLLPKDQIGSGQNFKAQEQQFELDVIVSYNHRFFLFSVTTDPEKPMCQSKMFEAFYRARQVGGSLARSAVVCLADEKTEEKCYKSLGSNPRNQIFGLVTLQGWVEGDSDALKRLKNFMEKE